MNESNIQAHIWKEAGSLPGVRLFRNSVALGWVGHLLKMMPNGTAMIEGARRNAFGLCKGSGDLIGWKSVTITPDMVGKKFAVFVSLEVKTEKGRTSDDQTNWRRVVESHGGIAAIVRSPEEVPAIFL